MAVDGGTVIAKCRYFRQIGLWPRQSELDFEGWLQNFLPAEREFAVALLNNFCFFSNDLTQQLFQACFHSISKWVCRNEVDYRSAEIVWHKFTGSLIITRVTGEVPNDTDSSFRYVRMARQQLGISEDQIMQPDVALEARIREPDRPLVFVDDFLGSGEQFLETWKREYWVKALASTSSFAAVCRSHAASVVYCVPVSTRYGIGRISGVVPSVKIQSVHILNSADSVGSLDSECWPLHLKRRAIDFIEAASLRAGYTKADCLGFHKLGLCLAFEHSVPDATIPLIHSERRGWKPLRRKS